LTFCRVSQTVGTMRASALAIVLLLASCGPTPTATVSGDAFIFNGGVDGRVVGGRVYVLEDPTFETTTDATGHFELEGVPVGSDVTLVLDHPEYVPIQTGTHVVPDDGLDRVTFQAVPPGIYDALATLLEITPDPTLCQMVTTVTRVGRSLYEPNDHGEAGATVSVTPPIAAELGPIYFNESVIPDRTLTETSLDGGVLYYNVPPGDYVWTASKDGAEFDTVRITCRPGVLVNASPPRGLQRR
jgi:hypothetical protein